MPTNITRVIPKKIENQPLVSAAPAPPEASAPSSIDAPESNNVPEEGILCLCMYVLFTKMNC